MAFQTQIYNNMPIGIEGEYADDSPRRDTPFVLLANETQAGTQATAKLAFTANPADGDTLTISSIVYRFPTLNLPNATQGSSISKGGF